MSMQLYYQEFLASDAGVTKSNLDNYL